VPDDDDDDGNGGGAGTGSPGGCEMPPNSATHWTAAVSYNIAGGGFRFRRGSSSCAARAKGYDTQTTKYDGTLIAAIAVPGSRARETKASSAVTGICGGGRVDSGACTVEFLPPLVVLPFLCPYTVFCLLRASGRHMALRVDGPQIPERLVIVTALSGAACPRWGGGVRVCQVAAVAERLLLFDGARHNITVYRIKNMFATTILLKTSYICDTDSSNIDRRRRLPVAIK